MKRWVRAQEYEQLFWKGIERRILSGISGQLSWYKWKAEVMEEKLATYLHDERKSSANILEIGSGPIGIVSFMQWGKRYTIDPLENFYRSSPLLSQLRNPEVSYTKGVGEDLHFDDGRFNLVILDNVLDHTSDPDGVFSEIHRVLAKGGLLYLTVNLHTLWGAYLHAVAARLLIDKGHPYTFTIKSIREFIHKHHFSIKSEYVSDYYSARDRDRKSGSLKDKAKGYSGISEFLYDTLAAKIPHHPHVRS